MLEQRRWRRLKIIPSDRLVIDCRGVEKWGKIDYIVRGGLIVASGESIRALPGTQGNVRKESSKPASEEREKVREIFR